MNEEKKTVGQISLELSQKQPDSKDPIELQREMQKEYIDNLLECVTKHKKEYNSDFYVVVLTKKERLMQNVLRNYFLAAKACPTPTYDQAVYKYRKENEDVVFLWVVPSKDTCEHFKTNALDVMKYGGEERELLRYVLLFYDKKLDELAMHENGEHIVKG